MLAAKRNALNLRGKSKLSAIALRLDGICGSAEISRNLALIIRACPSLSIQTGETVSALDSNLIGEHARRPD